MLCLAQETCPSFISTSPPGPQAAAFESGERHLAEWRRQKSGKTTLISTPAIAVAKTSLAQVKRQCGCERQRSKGGRRTCAL